MNKILGIILGLILLLVPIYDWITDFTGLAVGPAALSLLKGTVVWLLILIGAVLLIFNLGSLRN
jgi:hypothetical protein